MCCLQKVELILYKLSFIKGTLFISFYKKHNNRKKIKMHTKKHIEHVTIQIKSFKKYYFSRDKINQQKDERHCNVQYGKKINFKYKEI